MGRLIGSRACGAFAWVLSGQSLFLLVHDVRNIWTKSDRSFEAFTVEMMDLRSIPASDLVRQPVERLGIGDHRLAVLVSARIVAAHHPIEAAPAGYPATDVRRRRPHHLSVMRNIGPVPGVADVGE